MALESVAAAESLIPSNEENDDLEDGEIPSDEDDQPTVPVPVPVPEPSKSSESQKDKNSDSKSSKNKSKSSTTSSSNNNSNKSDRFSSKYGKNPSEDWAGDVEKAIKAVLDEEKPKNSESSNKSKSKSSSSSSNSRSKNRKRNRDEREDDRSKEQKKRRMSDDENGNDDDDEMLFVRGASPSRRENESSPLISRRSPKRSPLLRRSHDGDIYDDSSDRDSDDRSSRHRDDKRSNARGTTPRRSQKSSNERGGGGGGGKNKNRGQTRNDRNNSRRNQNDNIQDPESICVYFMQGKCHRGDDCPFSHNALPPRKMELCKFYLMDCCAKREKCLYMHHDFPCKFFHTGLKCLQAANCKFSHEPLNEQVKNILLKHLETAPKEILGDFPRLSREGALLMINNAARHTAQGQDASTQKIPSLFDVALPVPAGSLANSNKGKDDENSGLDLARCNLSKSSKSSGKKTRWGSNDDRAPLDHILLLQQVGQLNLHIPNITLAMQQQIQNRLMIQQCLKDIQNKNMEFYSENVQGSPAEQLFSQALPKLNNDGTRKDDDDDDNNDDADKNKLPDNSSLLSNNLDLRAFIAQHAAKNIQFSSLADEAANWAKTKFDEESDKEEESGLVIEVPVDDDEDGKNKEKDEEKIDDDDDDNNKIHNVSSNEPNGQISEQENPLSHLPSKAQELFLRIQRQQRSMAQDDATNALSAIESAMKDQEEWYSDDSDDDDDDDDDNDRNVNDDDDDGGNLQIVIKDNQSEKSDQESPQKESPEKSIIPQPAVIVDTLGDLSKIDISAEVTKLLSSIKPQGSSLLNKKDPNHESSSTTTTTTKNNNNDDNKINQSSPDNTSSRIKIENDTSSPMNSPSTSSIPVSRDPRMSRDPRQRRLDDNSSAVKPNSPSRNEIKIGTKSLRLETSIYSSGIMDAGDVDFRSRLDQDHRRQDMDLRQRFQDFGDTDLRLAGNSSSNFDSNLRSDIDLRQMLMLPFKPAPTHVPCTEIDGSLASHSLVAYKVYVVDIPRPNYTGLKLSKNDGAVKYDPRLRKIFRLTKSDIADSPMSPPPVKPDTPKSPPPLVQSTQAPPSPQVPVRVDPRRKALELATQSSQGGDMTMGLGGLGQNPMLVGMGQNTMLGGMMQPANMGMNMGPNGPIMNASQISFDPHYNNGLLGPAPGLGYSDGPNYSDGPGYQGSGGGNYGNFGPCQNDNMMGYGQNQMNYGNDWPNSNNNGNNNSNNQGPMRRGGRMRRRNRNKPNLGPGNRGNRSPM